jgi:hypothetical protein
MPASYTAAEKRRKFWLIAKASKQSLAGDRNADTIDERLKAEVERIDQRAEERGKAEAAELERRLSQARRDSASARVTMRTSSGKERADARRQMQEHEQAGRRIERELRRYR